jgi:hypothetical protein
MATGGIIAWIRDRYGWRSLVWAGLLAALAVTLDFLPLVDVLGFDFCFVMGLASALAGVDLGHGTVAAARRAGSAGPVAVVVRAVLAGLSVLALPLAVSLANALRVRNCNLGAGFVFFLLLPVSTMVYASGTGAALAMAVPRPRLGRILAFGLPLVSVAWALWRLYRDPAVFAFDPYAGYFPGPIYDEALRPPLPLLLFRLANLTWLGAVVALLHVFCLDPTQPLRIALRPDRVLALPLRRALVALGLLVASALWFSNGERLGFRTSHAYLAKLLPRETRSQHFALRTDPAVDSDDDVALVEQDLEFRYFQLTQTLGGEPALPITVYRFPSAAAKKDAVGAATTLFAKPWTREIFVQADRFPAHRLRHEMAHVFASAFGDPVFGVSLAWHFFGPVPIPRLATGLIEGVAEAADFDDPYGRFTTHEEAAAMIALGKAPPLSRAIGAGFSLESGPRAYTIAGSFCRYLLEQFGVSKLRELYRSAGEFERIYGVPLSKLEAGWRTFLAGLPVDQNSRAQAEESFRRPAIFHKVCARELGARVSEARARMGTAPASAALLLASACSDDPDEPTYRLDLAEAQFSAGKLDLAFETLARLKAAGNLTRDLRFRLANLEAGIELRRGRMDACEGALKEALANATDDAEERTAMVKLRALSDENARTSLGRVLFGDERGRPLDPGLIVFLITRFAERAHDALGPYLVGRQLSPRDPELAMAQFAYACPLHGSMPEVPLPPVFLKECRRQWSESAYLAGDLDAAGATANWIVSNSKREADRLRAGDFLARIDWKRSRGFDFRGPPAMVQPRP